jgi:hypothetical protein
MTISNSAKPLPLPLLGGKEPIVDPRTGVATPYFLGIMQQTRLLLLGANRIIPCEATGTNLITLTPLYPVAPLIDAYRDFDTFRFIAAADSTGSVTATVVPQRGTLATVKVYKNGGAAQAGAGDVLTGRMYDATFNDALDGGAGGLVLK